MLTSLRVNVSLDRSESTYVACAGTTRSSNTLEDILTRPSSAGVWTSTATASLLLTGLSPTTNYTVLCVSMSSSGQYSTLSQALSRRVYATTSCCKSLIGELALSSVIVGTKVIDAVQVTVGFLPTQWVSVSIVVLSGSAVFYPSAQNITALSKSMLSFDLVESGSIGNVSIAIAVAGPSSEEFIDSGTNIIVPIPSSCFRVITASQEPDVPVLNGVKFADNGLTMMATFSSATDRGLTASSSWFSCSTLFNSGTNFSSSSSKCQWSVDARSVTVQLAAYSKLVPGDSISLIGGVVRALCPPTVSSQDCAKWGTAPSIIVPVAGPSNPTVPTISVNVPSVINSCDGLLLDLSGSSGSGGREWKRIAFQVTSPDPDANTAQQYLNSNYQLAPPAKLPGNLFVAPYYYTVGVTMCNFLDSCATLSFSFSVVSTSVVTASVVGPRYRAIQRKSSYSLTVNGTVSHGCVSDASNFKSSSITYSWSITNAATAVTLPITSTSKDLTKLVINPFSLASLSTYTVSVVASAIVSGSTLTATATAQISVIRSALLVVIAGGSHQSVRKGQLKYSLDGSDSYDPDQSNYGHQGFQYVWSCVQMAPNFSTTSCGFLVNASSHRTSTLFIGSPSSIFADVTSLFTLVVSDATGRQAQAVTEVSLVPSLNPIVVLSGSQVGVYALWETVALSAIVYFPSGQTGWCKWSSDETSLSIANTSLTTAVTRYSLSSVGSSSSASVQTSVVLPPFTLPPSATLTLSLSCVLDSSPASPTVTSISVQTVSAPVPGTFAISPLVGVELQTIFSLSAPHWEDEALPLQYVIGYVDADSGRANTVLPLGPASFSSATLPAGDSSNEFALKCYLSVYNSYFANTSVLQSVIVSLSSLSQKDVVTLLTTALNTTGATAQAVSVFSSVLNRVNCSQSPNCTALNRHTCGVVPNTCGPCMSSDRDGESYVGIDGYSNEVCLPLSALLATSSSSLDGSCDSSAECSLTHECDLASRTCIPRSKPCLDADQCSGNGECYYADIISGSPVSGCFVGSLACSTSCECDSGYTGSNCQYTLQELRAQQETRELLVDALLALQGVQDVDFVSLEMLSTAVSSVTQKYIELSGAAAESSINSVSTILSQSASGGITLSALAVQSLIATIDNLATAVAVGAVNTSNIDTTIATQVSLLATSVVSRMVAGQSVVPLIGTNFRSQNAVNYVDQSTLLAVPLRAEETIFGMLSSGVGVISKEANGSASEAFSLILLKDSVFTNTFNISEESGNLTSSPLRLRFSGDTFCSASKLENNAYDFIFSMLHSESVQVPSSSSSSSSSSPYERQVVGQCKRGSGGNHSVYCDGLSFPDGIAANVTYYCDGIWDYNVTVTCPAMIRSVTPMCSLKVNEYLLPSSACTVINTSAWFTVCGCDVCSSMDSIRDYAASSSSSSRRLITGQDVADVVAASVIVSSVDFVNVLSNPGALMENGQFLYVLRVIIVFIFVWIGMPLCWALSIVFNKMQFKSVANKSKRRASVGNFMNNPSRLNASKVLIDYATSILPVMFAERGIFSRCWDVMIDKVPFFIVMCGSSKKFTNIYHVPIILFKMLTILTYGLFALSFFFSVQYPSDDGTCASYIDQTSCMQSTTALDRSLTKCAWQNVTITTEQEVTNHFQCSLSAPQYNAYMNIIMCILVVFATTPILFLLEKLFNDILLAPTSSELDSVDNESSSASDGPAALLGASQAMKKAAGTMRRVSVNIASQVQSTVAAGVAVTRRRQLYKVMEQKLILPPELVKHRVTAVQACGELPVFRRLADNISTSMKMDQFSNSPGSPSLAGLIDSDTVRVARPSSRERSVQRRRAVEDTWKEFLIDLKLCREQLYRPSDLDAFDAAWGIEHVNIDDGQIILSAASRDALRREFIHIQSRGHSALSAMKKMPRSMCGAELMKLFFLDIVGSSSVHAKILQEGVNEGVLNKKRVVTWSMKCLVIGGLIILNLFFVYTSLLYAANRDLHWQYAWVTNAVINIIIEVLFGPCLETFVLDCIIPGTIAVSVERAKKEVSKQVKRLCEGKSASLTATTRKFPDIQSKYFFAARVVANKRPDLMESSLVYGVETPFPFINRHTKKKIEERREAEVPRTTRSWFINSTALTVLIAHSVRYLGTAPMPVQKLFMQIVQPVFIGVFGFAFSFLLVHIGLAWSVLIVILLVAQLTALLAYILYRLLRKHEDQGSILPDLDEDITMFKSSLLTNKPTKPTKLKKRRSQGRERFSSADGSINSVDSSADNDSPMGSIRAPSQHQHQLQLQHQHQHTRSRARTVSGDRDIDGECDATGFNRKRTSSHHSQHAKLRQRLVSFDSESSDPSPRNSDVIISPRTSNIKISTSTSAVQKSRAISFDTEEDCEAMFGANYKAQQRFNINKYRGISFDKEEDEVDGQDPLHVQSRLRGNSTYSIAEEMKVGPLDDDDDEYNEYKDDEVDGEIEIGIGINSDAEAEGGEADIDVNDDVDINDDEDELDEEDEVDEVDGDLHMGGGDVFALHGIVIDEQDISSSESDLSFDEV
jgi:hypothetical protein